MSYSSERTLSQSSSFPEENFWVKFGFKWSRFLLLHQLFILSGTLHPSDCEGSLNVSLFLLITTFHWGYKLHICLVYFQVTVPIYSTSLTWPNTAWATADGGFFFPLVKPSGCHRRMWRWVTTNIRVPARCHTCITQGQHYLQSLSPPTCDTTQTWKK